MNKIPEYLVAENAPDEPMGFVESFAGYRNLRRRFAKVARRGISIPFFQPRDGVSLSTIRWGGNELINFSGYNYLGLSGDPRVSAAAKAAIDKFGTSASASRIVSGQIELHNELERRLAAFIGVEDAIVFVSGYLTNVTVISHLMGRADGVILDSGVHNSILTGARLSEARVLNYPINDFDNLDAQLTKSRGDFKRGMLVGEGVYSMDGMLLDVKKAIEIKKKHNLVLMVDEAHSLGTLGKTGRGICEATGTPSSEVDVHMGTLSKALASCGGYIAGSKSLIEYLRFLAPGFIFSVGLSPPDTAAAIAALDILEREPERVQRLHEKVQLFRRLAIEAGLPLQGTGVAPVASMVVGDGDSCMLMSQKLLEQGIHVQPVVYPAVAQDGACLRFFVTLNHTEEQFRATIPALKREWENCARFGKETPAS